MNYTNQQNQANCLLKGNFKPEDFIIKEHNLPRIFYKFQDRLRKVKKDSDFNALEYLINKTKTMSLNEQEGYYGKPPISFNISCTSLSNILKAAGVRIDRYSLSHHYNSMKNILDKKP